MFTYRSFLGFCHGLPLSPTVTQSPTATYCGSEYWASTTSCPSAPATISARPTLRNIVTFVTCDL